MKLNQETSPTIEREREEKRKKTEKKNSSEPANFALLKAAKSIPAL